jgi:hypothetical protein
MVQLRETNRQQIKSFFETNEPNNIEGLKLQALYKLIQSKGETIDEANTKKVERFIGCKALHIGKGIYLALKHTPIKKGSFYPCKLEQLFMKELKN